MAIKSGKTLLHARCIKDNFYLDDKTLFVFGGDQAKTAETYQIDRKEQSIIPDYSGPSTVHQHPCALFCP